MTTTTTIARTTRTPRSPTLHYTVRSTLLTMKNFSFVLFSIGLPVILYVVFSSMFGGTDPDTKINWSAMIMINMAAYGALGAAMSGGSQLALERRSGWFRQLAITALPPRRFLLSKAAVIMAIVLPALILVFAAGYLIGDVRAPAGQWLAALALMWLGLIPMTILGIVIGVWVKAEAVAGVTTLMLLLLAMLGGLWFPEQQIPSVMQTIAHALPSYWLAELGRFPFLPAEAAFPWTGIGVLGAWSVGLTVVGGLGYRRATAQSRR